MLLVVDIGNTNTVVGIFKDDKLVGHWRITSAMQTSDELGLLVCSLLHTHDHSMKEIKGAITASVVPRLEEVWRESLRRYVGITPYSVKSSAPLGMKIEMDNPSEVGADRLVNAVAAKEKYGYPLIAVDLGTAITLDVVSKDGAYIGGTIAPGLAVSVETLFSRTAQLPQIPLAAPERAIGKNTIHAIQSGIVYGFVGLVDALAERVFDELGTRTPVIATGGHAGIVSKHSRTITNVEPWLTLDGLEIIYRRCAAAG